MIYLFSIVCLALLVSVQGATSDPQCEAACSNYSITLGWCYGPYGDEPALTNYTNANNFVACVCEGQTGNGPTGNATANEDYGICASCITTPPLIVKDLDQVMTLCAIQSKNGTAANATMYFPEKYNTDANPAFNGAAADAAQLSSARSAISFPRLEAGSGVIITVFSTVVTLL